MKALICLNAEEKTKLRELETTIRRGVKSFVEVGNALREIRDSYLYRETHKTFEKYVREKWELDKAYAHRLICSAEVAADLVPMGTKTPKVEEIKTERQMRELIDVPSDFLPEVIEKAAEIAGDSRITAKVLKQAREVVLCTEEEREEVDEFDEVGVDVVEVTCTELPAYIAFKTFMDQYWNSASPHEKEMIRALIESKFE